MTPTDTPWSTVTHRLLTPNECSTRVYYGVRRHPPVVRHRLAPLHRPPTTDWCTKSWQTWATCRNISPFPTLPLCILDSWDTCPSSCPTLLAHRPYSAATGRNWVPWGNCTPVWGNKDSWWTLCTTHKTQLSSMAETRWSKVLKLVVSRLTLFLQSRVQILLSTGWPVVIYRYPQNLSATKRTVRQPKIPPPKFDRKCAWIIYLSEFVSKEPVQITWCNADGNSEKKRKLVTLAETIRQRVTVKFKLRVKMDNNFCVWLLFHLFTIDFNVLAAFYMVGKQNYKFNDTLAQNRWHFRC